MIRQLLSGTGDTTQLIIQLLIYAIILFTCFPIHECAHALTAKWLGDDTAARQGRITLNPLAHLDPIGSIMMVLFGIGWAKPVQTNPVNYTRKFFGKRVPMKVGMALTALAGPVSNIVLAYIAMIGTKIWLNISLNDPNSFGTPSRYYVFLALTLIISVNCSLAVFNLLPVPPLDGSRILLVVLKEKHYFGIMRYERYIMIGLMIVMFTGVFSVVLTFLSGGLMSGLDFLSGFAGSLYG